MELSKIFEAKETLCVFCEDSGLNQNCESCKVNQLCAEAVADTEEDMNE